MVGQDDAVQSWLASQTAKPVYPGRMKPQVHTVPEALQAWLTVAPTLQMRTSP